MKFTLFERAEVECWGDGAKGVGHARSRVGMTRQGDVDAEESGQKVGAVFSGPWVGIPPSIGRYVGARAMSSAGIEVEALFWLLSCILSTRLATLVYIGNM